MDYPDDRINTNRELELTLREVLGSCYTGNSVRRALKYPLWASAPCGFRSSAASSTTSM